MANDDVIYYVYLLLSYLLCNPFLKKVGVTSHDFLPT